MNAHYTERNEAWAQKCKEIEEVRSLLNKYTEIEQKLINELKDMSYFTPSRGGGYRLSSYIKRGNIDYSQIPELKYVDVEEFRKPSIICWKLEKERDE